MNTGRPSWPCPNAAVNSGVRGGFQDHRWRDRFDELGEVFSHVVLPYLESFQIRPRLTLRRQLPEPELTSIAAPTIPPARWRRSWFRVLAGLLGVAYLHGTSGCCEGGAHGAYVLVTLVSPDVG